MAGQSQVMAQMIYACLLIGATAFVHAIFVAAGAAVYRSAQRHARGALRFVRDTGFLVVMTFLLMAAHLIEIAMWAGLFLRLELFATLEAALYFASVCYTTLGFGDVLLAEEWRLLSGACAASGLLLFGMSAAFLFDIAAKLRLSD